MDKKRMKRMIGIAIPRALIITGISYNGYIRTHTFTLSGGVVKNELIQPINNKIKVSGNADTDVIFTDTVQVTLSLTWRIIKSLSTYITFRETAMPRKVN